MTHQTLECPCCGDIGAITDIDSGKFYDGQPLACGCAGHVSVDAESEPWIMVSDEPCPPDAQCNQPQEGR